jgi:putative Mn2+ efflux pump MntP
MPARRRLFMNSAKAALLFTGASWGLVLIILGFMPEVLTHRWMSITAAVILPDALGTWLIFNRLRLDHARDDARRAATVFALSAPVALAVSYPLAGLVGGYAEGILGSRFILPAVLVFVVLVMISVPGIVVAWPLHPSGGAGAVAESHPNEHC